MESRAGSTPPQTPLMRQDLEQSMVRHAINPLALSAFQRILLTTDGTVTEILEGFCGESIRLVKLFQEVSTLDRAMSSLELAWGQQVLRRNILLQGRMSLVNFIYAESAIALDRLDEPVRNGLIQSQKPIGLLILEQRIETFKEILDCGREPAGPLADYFQIDADASMIFRTYRMINKGHPIMVITEKFPESYFRDWDPTSPRGASAPASTGGPYEEDTREIQRIVAGLEPFVRREILGGKGDTALGPDAELLGGELVDSKGLFSLLGFIAERFGVRLDDDDLVAENFRTLGTIAGCIAKRRPRRSLRAD